VEVEKKKTNHHSIIGYVGRGGIKDGANADKPLCWQLHHKRQCFGRPS
jgi:hypothetical protein